MHSGGACAVRAEVVAPRCCMTGCLGGGVLIAAEVFFLAPARATRTLDDSHSVTTRRHHNDYPGS